LRTPDDIRIHLIAQEWHRRQHFRGRILKERIALEIPLKPPSGEAVSADPVPFQQFLKAWSEVKPASLVRWEERNLRGVGPLRVPTHVLFPSTLAVAQFIGDDAVERLRQIAKRLKPFEAGGEALRQAAARSIHTLEALSVAECEMLGRALLQLRTGIGTGLYLRSLPLDGVDTKLLERQGPLIERIAVRWKGPEIEAAGGFTAWLGCLSRGADRVMLRPLSPELRRAFCGLSRIWVGTDQLGEISLPGSRLLIVENEVSGLALPDLPDTVAVAGCGNNLSWLSAAWVTNRAIGYWGDLDSWGMRLLAHARSLAPQLQALLMDRETWEMHASSRVAEPASCERPAEGLVGFEWALFDQVRGTGPAGDRLEQEKLEAGFVQERLQKWVNDD